MSSFFNRTEYSRDRTLSKVRSYAEEVDSVMKDGVLESANSICAEPAIETKSNPPGLTVAKFASMGVLGLP